MEKTYRQKVAEWHQEKEDVIRRENGWLSLAGLYWLKLGKNRFGSDPACEILLPERVPPLIGSVDYNGKSVSLHTEGGQKVDVNGKLTDFSILQPDISNEPSYINLNDVRLVVIQRGNRMGIRMWDNARKERSTFPPRTWYETDERFHIPAHYTLYDRPRNIFFPDVTGEKTESTVDGYLTFEFGGNNYQLDVTKEEEGEVFLRFKDPTSDKETYPTGRYLVVKHDKEGNADLDFNFSYSPPCAFTDFATCFFAPEQNHLDFRVEAGETYMPHLHKE